MNNDKARGVDLDVVERQSTEHLAALAELGVIKPNEIRINGQAVLVPKNTSIDFETGEDGVAVVRLSMFVRSLRVGLEDSADPNVLHTNDERLAELVKVGTKINSRDGLNLRDAPSAQTAAE
ncbi:hypothetical protein [Nocardia sp. NBC_01388]|uniref:hypothetical protein n=1 Tax=Nocardia sp. NBC_01388 TaxID=2903596 RepID=UPI0032544338